MTGSARHGILMPLLPGLRTGRRVGGMKPVLQRGQFIEHPTELIVTGINSAKSLNKRNRNSSMIKSKKSLFITRDHGISWLGADPANRTLRRPLCSKANPALLQKIHGMRSTIPSPPPRFETHILCVSAKLSHSSLNALGLT